MNISSQRGFAGVDERALLANGIERAVEMRNLYITPAGAMRKRPSVVNEYTFDAPVDGLLACSLFGKSILAVASGGQLYIASADDSSPFASVGDIGSGECLLFTFGGFLYIKAGSYYGRYDGEKISEVEGYIPTVAMSCAPDGSGTLFEQVNLICPKRRQLFSCDGQSVLFRLAERGIESLVSVRLDGVDYDGDYVFDPINDAVSFEVAPAEGLNNLEIIYKMKDCESDRARILDCTKIMLFGGNSDGRAFLWGNKSYPNYRFHSDLANGVPSVEYFPVNSFTVIGSDAITCIVQQYDRQLIFTERAAFYSYCELKTDALGNVVSSFPVFSLNGGKGCLFETNGCVIDNRPVTLCDDGLNLWESTSVLNEKNAVCFSSPVCESVAKADPSDAHLIDFQSRRELWFISLGLAVIYNYGINAFYIYDGFGGTHFDAFGDRLYYSSGAGVYSFSYGDSELCTSDCIWRSGSLLHSHESGRCDVVSLEADLYIQGELDVSFEITDGVNTRFRRIRLNESNPCFRRISFRPSIKRTLPFSITVRIHGGGHVSLHGITIKTKEKERSSRYGLL